MLFHRKSLSSLIVIRISLTQSRIMQVLVCVVLIVVCVGNPAHGFPGAAPPPSHGSAANRGHKGESVYGVNYSVREETKTEQIIKHKDSNDTGSEPGFSTTFITPSPDPKPPSLRAPDTPVKQSTDLLEPTGGSPTTSTPAASHSLQQPSLDETAGRTKNEDQKLRLLDPPPPPVPTPAEVMRPCKGPRADFLISATAPPDVCDLCPTTADGGNPLDPCTCVGVSGNYAGKISITCPPSITSGTQIQYIFSNTDFLTTHVYEFTLKGSNMTSTLNQDMWGPLDFVNVFITDNKITYVDNEAFARSNSSLTVLSLENNEIEGYFMEGEDLPKLYTLNLQGNRLTIFYSNFFIYRSLRHLYLSFNQIHSLGKNCFAALSKLESLHLAHNNLTTLESGRFNIDNHNPDKGFIIIDLSSNRISHISATAFTGLLNPIIDFRMNPLSTIREAVFHPIILSSHYYNVFTFSDHVIVCDCSLLWVVTNSRVKSCFNNFICANNNLPLYLLKPSDLGNCTEAVPVL